MSQVAKTLDTAVAAFHRRPSQNRYKALMLDGVVLSRKTGAPAARSAARCFAQRFHDQYPQAVACLRNDLDELLTCFRYKIEAERRAVRTPHRTPLSRSQTKDTANGHLPGQNQHGSHLIRRDCPTKTDHKASVPLSCNKTIDATYAGSIARTGASLLAVMPDQTGRSTSMHRAMVAPRRLWRRTRSRSGSTEPAIFIFSPRWKCKIRNPTDTSEVGQNAGSFVLINVDGSTLSIGGTNNFGDAGAGTVNFLDGSTGILGNVQRWRTERLEWHL